MENETNDADEWAAEAAEEARDRERKAEPAPDLSREDFLAWRSPRVVDGNPTRVESPLWPWLVRTRWSAWSANQTFDGPSSFEAGPMWCFERFGPSTTPLPDGRVVHIGGEHEDDYDPDFQIYNDVVVIDVDGAIAIHGYAPDAFPPTDFHSATLVGDAIVVIGTLGYPPQRVLGATPVHRLSLATLAFAPMATHGDGPGWLHRHAATLTEDGGAIVVRGGMVWRGEDRTLHENIDAWSLDLASGRWTRLSALDWQRWTMLRVDRQPNRLWDVRQELWRRDHGWPGMESHWRHDVPPDFEALEALYRLDADAPAPQDTDKYNVYRIVVDGVAIRFTEHRFFVDAIVEGRLSAARLAALQAHLLATLARLDASEWAIEAA